jgi:nucleoside transporter
MNKINSARESGSSLAAAPSAAAVYARLSIMMFLEFAIWGSWAVLVAGHMRNLGFTDPQINLVYLTTAIGAMLSPLIAGWIADRFVPNQIFTGVVHLVGAALLLVAWQQRTFLPLWTVILLYAVLYMPTIALTNAIAFYHMKDSKKFGNIRVWGTIGWIVINWIMSLYLMLWEGTHIEFPFKGATFALHWDGLAPGVSHIGECLIAAALLSAVMGLYCFSLPNVPPSKEAKNPYAFLEALRLTSIRNFAVLLVISLIVAIELPFYYNLTFLFLTEPGAGIGLKESQANLAMSLGQIAEVAIMLLLAPSLRHLGMRTTIALGILAWPVRYAIFAIGQPTWLVIAAQSLHGICYSFFFVGGMIAAERLSHKDIRASAQGLMVFATNGVGMLLGSILAGQIASYFLLPSGGHAWAKIFLVPIVITIVGAIAFVAVFNERQYQADSTRIEAEDAAA